MIGGLRALLLGNDDFVIFGRAMKEGSKLGLSGSSLIHEGRSIVYEPLLQTGQSDIKTGRPFLLSRLAEH
jgi:hypothetical protein